MNFWVIISYLKVKNLSRNVAPEKCKKQPQSPLQSLPGETKQQKQPHRETISKKHQWGLWGLLFLTAYRKPNFLLQKRVKNRFPMG